MRLFIHGRVPNRKPKINPCTVSGFPLINTFQGMDCQTTAKGSQIAAPNALHALGGWARGGGRKRLHKSNLCHRVRKADQNRAITASIYDQARVLGLEMDRQEGRMYARSIDRMDEFLLQLKKIGRSDLIDDLIATEKCRGAKHILHRFMALFTGKIQTSTTTALI